MMESRKGFWIGFVGDYVGAIWDERVRIASKYHIQLFSSIQGQQTVNNAILAQGPGRINRDRVNIKSVWVV